MRPGEWCRRPLPGTPSGHPGQQCRKVLAEIFLETTEADFDALIGLHAKGGPLAMQEASRCCRNMGVS